MKSSAVYTLVTVTAVFAMCASVMAGTPAVVNEPSDFRRPCVEAKHHSVSVPQMSWWQIGQWRPRLYARPNSRTEARRHHQGRAGEMPKNGPKLTPQQFSQLKKELGMTNAGASSASNQAPPTSPLAKRPAPNTRSLKATAPGSSNASTLTAPPQAHISVIPASDNVPTARVQVVPPGTNKSQAGAGAARARQIAKPAPPKPRLKNILPPAGLPKEDTKPQADLSDAAKEDTSKVSDEIKGMAGDWMAVSRQGDGELSTIELQLDDHGWAKLTVPSADGKSSTTTHKVEVEKNELKLTGASSSPDITLGKLVSVDDHQMVFERSTGLLTFVRP